MTIPLNESQSSPKKYQKVSPILAVAAILTRAVIYRKQKKDSRPAAKVQLLPEELYNCRLHRLAALAGFLFLQSGTKP